MQHEVQNMWENFCRTATQHEHLLTGEQKNKLNLFSDSVKWSLKNGFTNRVAREVVEANKYLNNILFS
jgi:hypothetical protein